MKISKKFQSVLNRQSSTTRPTNLLIEFSDFFKTEKYFLNCGVNNLPIKNSSKNQKWFKYHMVFFTFANALYLIMFIGSFFASMKENAPLMEIVENAVSITVFASVLCKVIFVIYLKREKIKQIVEKLDQHFPHSARDQHVYGIKDDLKLLNTFYRICLIIFCSVYFQYTFMPFFAKLYGYFMSVDVALLPIINLRFPFHEMQMQPIAYIIINSFHIWFLGFTMNVTLASELVAHELLSLIIIKFKIIGKEMSEINPRDDEIEAIKKMNKLVDIHKELIDICESLEEVFSVLLLFDIFSTMAMICGGLFYCFVRNFKIFQREVFLN